MFSKEPLLQPRLMTLFTSLCDTTISLLQNSTDLPNQTDVVEEFMQFLSQVVKKNKQVVALSGVNMLGLYQAGILGLSMPEHHTVKHSCIFISTFVNAGVEVPSIKELIHSHGHLLVERILRAIGGESPLGIVDYYTIIVFSLLTHHYTEMTKWFEHFFAVESFPSIRATKHDKDEFCKAILMQRVNKLKAKELIKEFSLTCRGLIGTEYAQTVTASSI